MISQKQRKILAYIEDFIGEFGYPPTYEEIRVGLGISSKSLVNYHLEALQDAKLISRAPNTPRAIRLRSENGTVRVPVAEDLAANEEAALAELDPRTMLELTYDIVPDAYNLYAFKVQDDSHLDALVTEGDILVVQAGAEVKNGDLVAARLIGQKVTAFRRYYRENGHVRLQPDNPAMESLIIGPDAVEVRGKVVAVIRQVE